MPGLHEGGVYEPRSNRCCTDILCLVLLLAVWIAMGTVTVLSVRREPDLLDRLRYPQDEYGQFCGKPGTATADLRFSLYPILDADFRNQASAAISLPFWEYYTLDLTSICVAECPDGVSLAAPVPVYGGEDYPTGDATRTEPGWDPTPPEFSYTFRTAELFYRCLPLSNRFDAPAKELCAVPDCAAAMGEASLGVAGCAEVVSRPEEVTTWELCPEGASAAACEAQQDFCSYSVRVETSQTFRPSGGDDETDTMTRKLASYVALTLRIWDSVVASYGVIIVLGIAFPILFGFVYALALYLFAGIMVWTLLALLILGMCTLSVILCIHAGWVVIPADVIAVFQTAVGIVASANATAAVTADAQALLVPMAVGSTSKDLYIVFAVLSIAATLLMLIWICLSWRAIRRTIAITHESSKVFSTLPALMVWPLVDLVFLIGFIIYGILGLGFVAYPPVWGGGTTTAALCILHVVGTLWSIQFVRACDYTTTAGAVSYWFCTTNAERAGCCGGAARCCQGLAAGCGLPRVLDAAWTVVSRHMGSLAFGSFIMTVVQIVRLVLYAIHTATKKTGAEDGSYLIKLLFRCAMCAVWCLEKSIEFITTYAYVHVAVDGTNFCTACKDTFCLIIKYPAQTAVNSLVKRLLCGVLLGLSTPFIAAAACFLYLDSRDDFTVHHSPLYSAVFVFLISWFVAAGIANVFEAILDTVFLCAFQDMDQNSPPLYLSDSMRKALGVDSADKEAGKSANYYVKTSERHQRAGNHGKVPAQADAEPPADAAPAGSAV